MKTSTKVAIPSVLSLSIIASLVLAASPPAPVSSGTITVSAPPGLVVQSATMNGTNCPSLVCPATSFPSGPGTYEVLSIVVKNPASIGQNITAPSWTFASTNTSTSTVLSISPAQTYPDPVSPNSQATVTFQVNAIGQGSDSFTLTV